MSHPTTQTTDLNAIQRNLLDALSALSLASTHLENSTLSEYSSVSVTVRNATRATFLAIQTCERALPIDNSPTQIF